MVKGAPVADKLAGAFKRLCCQRLLSSMVYSPFLHAQAPGFLSLAESYDYVFEDQVEFIVDQYLAGDKVVSKGGRQLDAWV